MRRQGHNSPLQASESHLELSGPVVCTISNGNTLSLFWRTQSWLAGQRLLVWVKPGAYLTHRHVEQSRCRQTVSLANDGSAALLDGVGGHNLSINVWPVFLGVTTPDFGACMWSTCGLRAWQNVTGGGVEQATSLPARIAETTGLVMASFEHLGEWAVHLTRFHMVRLAIPWLGKHTSGRHLHLP